MFNSTGIFDVDGEDVNSPSPSKQRRMKFNFHKVQPFAVDKSAVVTELILSSTGAQDAIAKLQASAPAARANKGPDVVSVLLEQYTSAVNSIKEENKKLRESIADETPLPLVEETRSNTSPKGLVAVIDRLIQDFGAGEDLDSSNHNQQFHQESGTVFDLQTQQESEQSVDDILRLTSSMLDRAQLAEKIERFNRQKNLEVEDVQ